MSARRIFGVVPLQIAQALLGFGAIAAFTRLMTPAQFGEYALALSASMLAHTLVFTWAEAAAYRYFAAAKAHGRLQDHFATLAAMALALAAGAALATGALLFLLDLSGHIAALCAFAAGAAIMRFFTRLMRESERADLDTARYAFNETLYLALGFAAGVAALVWLDLGPAAPFAGLALAGAIMLAIDAPRLVKRAEGGAVLPSRARSYAAYGAPLAAALAIDLGVQTLTRFILAHQGDFSATGAYAAAAGLSRPLDIIFLWAGAALTPALMAAYEQHGADAARETGRKIFTLLAAIAMPAALGLALLAQPLAAFMIGAGLSAEAARALPWLAFAALFAGFNNQYWTEAFQLTHRTGLRAFIMLAPGAMQVALTYALAPHYGGAGAAIGALAAAAVGACVLILFGRRLLALPLPLDQIARIGAACVLMAGAIVLLPAPHGFYGLAFDVAAGVAAYAIAAYAFDIGRIRARVSVLSQTLDRMMRARFHSLFTDRADVRAR